MALSSNCWKYLVLTFNILFAMSALVLFGVSGFLLYRLFIYRHFIGVNVEYPAILLLIMAIITCSIAWIGWRTAKSMHQIHIIMAGLLIILVVVIEFSCFVWAMVVWDNIEIDIKTTMTSYFLLTGENKETNSDSVRWDRLHVKMSDKGDHKFYVIALFERPYNDPEKYVCVPRSWIKFRESSDDVAIVQIPLLELSEIKKLAGREEFSDNWTIYVADVIYGINSYKDASDYTKILNKIAVQEQNSTEMFKDIPSISDKKVLELPSSSKINEFRLSTPNNDLESVSKEIPKQEMKVLNVDSFPKATKHVTGQSLKLSSSSNNVNLLDQTENENPPYIDHCVEGSNKTDNNQNESPSNEHAELMQELENLIFLRSLLGNVSIREAFQQLHNQFEEQQLMFENFRLLFMTACISSKELIKLMDEARNSSYISTLDNSIQELQKRIMELNINENNSDVVTGSKIQNDTEKGKEVKKNDDTEDKNNSPLDKIPGRLALPPEYDINDSRWTLKHREMKDDLVELLPNSRVYINNFQLRNFIILSKDSKSLARKLFLEIFSENALGICSLTGSKPQLKPGLDEHARTVLLEYVQQHAFRNNWSFDTQIILTTASVPK